MARFSIRGAGEGSSSHGSPKRQRLVDGEDVDEEIVDQDREEGQSPGEGADHDDYGERRKGRPRICLSSTRNRPPDRCVVRWTEEEEDGGEDDDQGTRMETDDPGPDSRVRYCNSLMRFSNGVNDREEIGTDRRLGRQVESRSRVGDWNPLRGCSSVRPLRDSSLSVTLLDPEILDCNICYEPLSIPIFQCENGHIACSSCCTKLRNKCPSCSLPIGYNRCRAMEKVVESVRVPCLNAKFGCTEKFVYDTISNHGNNCSFAPCSCPKRNCTVFTSYKHLQIHYSAVHKDSLFEFVWGRPFFITLDHIGANKAKVVLQEEDDRDLFVVQRFRNALGESVSLSCIAPPVQETGEFSYTLVIKSPENSFKFESSRVKKIQKMNHSAPDSGFVLIPSYLLNAGDPPLKLELYIRRTSRSRVSNSLL